MDNLWFLSSDRHTAVRVPSLLPERTTPNTPNTRRLDDYDTHLPTKHTHLDRLLSGTAVVRTVAGVAAAAAAAADLAAAALAAAALVSAFAVDHLISF